MTPTRCRAAVEDVYEALAPTVRAEARRFARARRLDPEECEADANLVFVESVLSHDRGRSPVGARVRYRVRNELLARYRTWAKRNRRHPRAELPDGLTARPDPEPFDRAGFAAGLSLEALTVLRLLFDTPADLAELIRADPDPGPVSTRRCLRQFLIGTLGWARERVATTFAEIGEALT